METKTAKLDVTDKLDEIKRFMPETYKSIQRTAAAIGNQAYELVRRGLRGEPNCFFALEGGRVMGTPFSIAHIQADAAMQMIRWGCSYMCIFPETTQEA